MRSTSLQNGYKQQQERVVFLLILLAGVIHSLILEDGFGENAVHWVAVIVNTRLFVVSRTGKHPPYHLVSEDISGCPQRISSSLEWFISLLLLDTSIHLMVCIQVVSKEEVTGLVHATLPRAQTVDTE